MISRDITPFLFFEKGSDISNKEVIKMNKMKSVVIACLMVLFTLGAIMPASAATTTVSIDPATVTSDACETVSIMIQTDEAAGIGSATMTLVYNPAVVTYDSKVADGDLGTVTINEPVAGTLNMVAATGANPGPTGTVKFVDLKFCPVGAPEDCSDLDLTVTELTDGNVAVIVPDTVTDGEFCIPVNVDDPPQPRITSPANGDAVSGTVPVTAEDDSGEGDIAYALFEYYNDTNCNCAADDGNTWVEIENDTSSAGGWNTTWNTTLIPDCCHLIRVTMVDGTGQNGTDEINVVVSNHAPVPNITAPCDGDVLNRSVVISVTDERSEFGAGIAYTRFEYYYDENCNCAADDGNTWVEIGNDTDGTDGWSAEWDTLTDGVAAVPNGCYMLRATMVDMHGRTGSDEINVELSNPDFCIDLKAGKNLVSIPKAIIGPKHANDVFNLDPYAGEVCWYYRADLERYVANPIVKPCRGYWVFKNAPEMICVYFDDAAAAPTQSLREGWNMIGHIRTTAMPVYVEGSDADFGSITGLEEPEGTKLYRQIATYHDGTWTDYPAGSLEEMTPGWGYWISMKQNATMSGSWV